MNLIIDNKLIGLEVQHFLTKKIGKVIAVFVGGSNNELCFTVWTDTGGISSALAGEFRPISRPN